MVYYYYASKAEQGINQLQGATPMQVNSITKADNQNKTTLHNSIFNTLAA